MSEIIRQQSPAPSAGNQPIYSPEETNADLAAAALVKALMENFPVPSIDTRKFTIIHGLLLSLNHKEPKEDDPGHITYLDTSPLVELMDRVSEKSVNVDGRLFSSVWAYLMQPNYIITGMPQQRAEQEEKPGIIQRVLGWGKKSGGDTQKGN